MLKSLRDRVPSFGSILLFPLWCYLSLANTGWANPATPVVTNGAATFAQVGSTLTVTNVDKTIIQWQDFSIASGETTSFVQPTNLSSVLNRVTGGNLSQIFGTLQSNGKVFLINPNGILIGASGSINTAGFVASTLNVADSEFIAGGTMKFVSAGEPGTITNLGTIGVGSSDVILISKQITNSGTINAQNAIAGLYASDEVYVTDGQGASVRIVANGQGTIGNGVGTGVNNQGIISAARAEIKATGNLYALAIKNGGSIRATGTHSVNGVVYLEANGGFIQNTGTVAAQVPNNSGSTTYNDGGTIQVVANSFSQEGSMQASGLNGGNISINAAMLSFSGDTQANGWAGTGGNISILGQRAVMSSTKSLISASGTTDGGSIWVEATNPTGSILYLSGTMNAWGATGNGGTITATGESVYLMGTQINASGGNLGGNIRVGGGFQGSNPKIRNSIFTLIGPTDTFAADGGVDLTSNLAKLDLPANFSLFTYTPALQGSGGRIAIWSDGVTTFQGTITARGGLLGGDGGQMEVSGHQQLNFGGFGDASAPQGQDGNLLLDPQYITIDNSGNAPISPYLFEFIDPNKNAGNNFGATLLALSTGTFVITSSGDSFAAAGAGAVYLFGADGSLISTLRGSSAEDNIGGGGSPYTTGVVALTNGNYVIISSLWNGGQGAVTWGNGLNGVSGTVSASNSLVGSLSSDQVGYGGVTALTNGNYVVNSFKWSTNAGAVTWGNGYSGTTGTVSSLNSVVGSTSTDQVGSGASNYGYDGVIALKNGNYVICSPGWSFGTGAATWGNGYTGTVGTVSVVNSLIGSTAGDGSGEAVFALTNGNYVVDSYSWSSGTGAVTWGSGSGGVFGTVSVANSLVGLVSGDQVGYNVASGVGNVTVLANGNYVVGSTAYQGNVGAATWGNGYSGTSGYVCSTNSLVGSNSNDFVGLVITPLSNGNYVVGSPNYQSNTGAATWGNGFTGTTGYISSANSLIGSTAGDGVGGNITALTNGNYVVTSPNWNGSRGAATWGNGYSGTVGAVSVTNSLVGINPFDSVGCNGATALTNGNYLVKSPNWNAGAGAATWGNGAGGTTGTISYANSLIGTKSGDNVGAMATALTNGNYVVSSPGWNNFIGAATWGNGNTGTSGIVTTANSLTETTSPGEVGGVSNAGIIALANGNYLVITASWNGSRGAVTWGNGAGGTTGLITTLNSITGGAPNSGLGKVSYNNVTQSYGVSFTNDTSAGASGRVYASSVNGTGLWYNYQSAANITIAPGAITAITNTGTALVLQASDDITLNAGTSIITSAGGKGGNITMAAGRSIYINGSISTDNGNLSLIADDSTTNGVSDKYRDPGVAQIVMGGSASINTGTGLFDAEIRNGAGLTNNTSGVISLSSVTAGALCVTLNGPTSTSSLVQTAPLIIKGSTSLTSTNGDLSLTNANNQFNGQVSFNSTGSGNVSLTAASDLTFGTSKSNGIVTAVTPQNITLNGFLNTTNSDVILAAGKSFINNAGPSALNTGSGRWSIYSEDPLKDKFGGLISTDSFYNSTYGNNPTNGLRKGNYFFFQTAGFSKAGLSSFVNYLEQIIPQDIPPNLFTKVSFVTLNPNGDGSLLPIGEMFSMDNSGPPPTIVKAIMGAALSSEAEKDLLDIITGDESTTPIALLEHDVAIGRVVSMDIFTLPPHEAVILLEEGISFEADLRALLGE